MSKEFWATLLAPVLLFVSVQNASAMDGAELVSKLDSAAPNFSTDGCKSARASMAQYNGHVEERILEGALMWVAFGGIFALPAVLSQGGQEARVANYLMENLQTECGRQALFPVYLEAANQGEAPAQTWVAQSYESGNGAAYDPAQAISWYQKAIDQNFPNAMVNLGSMYFDGEGVASDPAHTVALWQKAADSGNSAAKANLGEAYFEGKGVQQDTVKAIAFWRDAAKKYDPSAQAYLGKAYLEGKGVEQNVGEALKDFRAASWNGSALAQYELGIMYETGAFMYSSGAFVPHSEADAYRWYAVAEENGFAPAASKRQALATKLSPDEKRKQDAAASVCVKSHFMNCP